MPDAEPSKENDFDLVEVGAWPAELHARIAGLEALDRIYELLKIDAPDSQLWHKGMDFLRSARQVRRAEIAGGILAAHGITLEEDEEPAPA